MQWKEALLVGRERQRETEKETFTETDRDRDTETERYRDREIQRGRDRESDCVRSSDKSNHISTLL